MVGCMSKKQLTSVRFSEIFEQGQIYELRITTQITSWLERDIRKESLSLGKIITMLRGSKVLILETPSDGGIDIAQKLFKVLLEDGRVVYWTNRNRVHPTTFIKINDHSP